MRRILAITTLLTLGIASLAGAADPVTLRYKFQADQSAPYRNQSKMRQAVSVAGQKFETTMEMDQISLRKVQSIGEDGTAQLETTTKQLKVRGDFGPAGKFTFDSEAEEKEEGTALAPILNPAFEALSTMTVRFKVTPRGEIKDVEGYAEAMKEVLKDNPTAAGFTGGGDSSAFAQGMADVYPLLPEAAVRPGDTWEHPYEFKSGEIGTFQGKRIYKLIAVNEKDDRQVAEISVTHQMDGDLDITSGEAKVTGKFAIGASEGTILLDIEAGQILSNKTKLTMNGDLVTAVNDLTIDTHIEQTQEVDVKLLESLPE